MILHRNFRLALLTATFVGLGACSSDDDDPGDTPAAGGTTPPVTMTPTEGDGGGSPDVDATPEDEMPVTGIDRTDMTPRISTSECGSLPILDTPVSTSVGNGATLVEGQLVRGRLEDDVPHYWDIALEAGFHHVVLDGAQGDDRDLNIGVTFVDLDAPEESAGSLLLDSDIGYRSRRVAFFEVPVARTVRFQATQSFFAEDYVFGVFPNGADVPSPRFDDCPEIMPLSLGTTQVVQIDETNTEEAHVWYRIDLEAGQYTVDVTATSNSTSDGVAYELFLLEEFGQTGEGTETTVLEVSATGRTATDAAAFVRERAGPVWLRLEEDGAGLDIEFTLNAANGG